MNIIVRNGCMFLYYFSTGSVGVSVGVVCGWELVYEKVKGGMVKGKKRGCLCLVCFIVVVVNYIFYFG